MIDNAQLMYLIVFSTLITLVLVVSFFFLLYILFFRDSLSPYEDEATCIPYDLQVKEIKYDRKDLYGLLSPIEQVRFHLARKFFELYRPALNYVGYVSYDEVDATYLMIRDRGIRAFYFESYQDQLTDLVQLVEDEERGYLEDGDEAEETGAGPSERSPLLSRRGSQKYNADGNGSGGDYRALKFTKVPYTVQELTEIAFHTSQMSSAIMNLPLPYKNRRNDTIYFETKLFEFDPVTTTISIGLTTKPYPNFQLPGLSPYSVAVQTDGAVRRNNMPYLLDDNLPVVLPQLVPGDVIGLGYRTMPGSVFITHNGKNVLEMVRRLKVELYPCIGSMGGPCKVSVNLGQVGFVFIEANVKKLGFCENQNEGTIGVPPSYNNTLESEDPLLDKGEELPPRYPEEEQTFFGTQHQHRVLIGSSDMEKGLKKEEKRSRESTPSTNPPSYKSDEKNVSVCTIYGRDATASLNATDYERMVNNFESPAPTPPMTPSNFETRRDKQQQRRTDFHEESAVLFLNNTSTDTDAGSAASEEVAAIDPPTPTPAPTAAPTAASTASTSPSPAPSSSHTTNSRRLAKKRKRRNRRKKGRTAF